MMHHEGRGMAFLATCAPPQPPLPPGEAGRRPGEGAFRHKKTDASTLAPLPEEEEPVTRPPHHPHTKRGAEATG